MLKVNLYDDLCLEEVYVFEVSSPQFPDLRHTTATYVLCRLVNVHQILVLSCKIAQI